MAGRMRGRMGLRLGYEQREETSLANRVPTDGL